MLVSSTGLSKQAFVVATSLSASRRRLSGWCDLNPRPVAAATALPYPTELTSTSSGLVISLALRRFGASGEAFAVD